MRFFIPNEAASKYPYTTSQLLKDIWAYTYPYKTKFFLATFLRLGGDLSNLYPPFAYAAVITFFSHYKTGQSLNEFFILMCLWILAGLWRIFALNYGKNIFYQLSEKVAIDAKQKAISHLSFLPTSWHEKENTGNKLQRIYRGGNAFTNILYMYFNNVIEICVNFIVMPAILWHSDRLIASLFFLYAIVYFISGKILMKKAIEATKQVNIQEEHVSGVIFEIMNTIRSIKALGMGQPLLSILQVYFKDLFIKIQERVLRFSLRFGFLGVCSNIFRFSGFFLVAYGILQGRYEVGFFILFNGYFSRIAESVQELTDISQQFVISKLSIARMQEIMQEPIEQEDDATKKVFPSNWKVLTLKNISFAYNEQQPVLEKLTFTLKPGERVGIVGLSGAGKSTLFKLLLKEYENYSGEILIGKTSLHDIQRKSYFEHIGVVLQDTEVFNFSLKENILLANPEQTSNSLLFEQALAVSHVSDFVSRLPQGVDTLIGEKGIKLSGGEKQRLGIARAIFKQPRILLLDEATSHLDVESEEKIQDSLHQFFQHITALVIAHRLTTIREMDRIVVLERGKIIEQGSFDELIKKQGRFFELWKKQKI